MRHAVLLVVIVAVGCKGSSAPELDRDAVQSFAFDVGVTKREVPWKPQPMRIDLPGGYKRTGAGAFGTEFAFAKPGRPEIALAASWQTTERTARSVVEAWCKDPDKKLTFVEREGAAVCRASNSNGVYATWIGTVSSVERPDLGGTWDVTCTVAINGTDDDEARGRPADDVVAQYAKICMSLMPRH